MKINKISPEQELALLAIANKYYPHSRFKLTVKVETDCIEIDFEGFFNEQAISPRPFSDPCNKYYRTENRDFSIQFFPGQTLFVQGFWRSALLVLGYRPSETALWSDEGEIISRPYPDGDKFEAIAIELYPLLARFLPS